MRTRIIKVFAILCLLCSSPVNAQTSIDSLAGKYLVDIKEIDSAIYRSNTKGKKQIVTTNYFVAKKQEILLNRISLRLYEFGSFTSHVRPHFMLAMNESVKDVCIIDCQNIETDIKAVFDFLNSFSNLPASLKIKALKGVIKEYPD